MNIGAVKAGLAAVLQEAFPDWNVHANMPAKVSAPCMFPAEIEREYAQTGPQSGVTFARGSGDILLTLRLLASQADESAGHELLDDLLSDDTETTLKAVIDGPEGTAQTFGDTCDDALMTRVTAYRGYTHASITYVGADVTILIVGS